MVWRGSSFWNTMNGAALGGGAGTVAYDTDAQAYFALFSTPPSTQRKDAYNTAILAMKSAGIWSTLDAWLVFERAQDAQSQLLNIRQNTFHPTLVSSPIVSLDGGITTNGTTSYINCNYNPFSAGGQFVRDSASYELVCLSDAQKTNLSGFFLGAGYGNTINPRSGSDTTTFRINQNGSSSFANTVGFGRHRANRSGASATQFYRDGVAQTVTTSANAASVAIATGNFNIGRDGASTYQALTCGGYSIGSSLDATKAAAFHTINATLLAALAP